MGLPAFEDFCSEPGVVDYLVKFVGGTNAVTKVFGSAVTVTYISTGIVDITLSETPGTWIGLTGFGFEASTASALKGYTVVVLPYNTTTKVVRVNITDATDTLANLAASQWLSLRLSFRQPGVSG